MVQAVEGGAVVAAILPEPALQLGVTVPIEAPGGQQVADGAAEVLSGSKYQVVKICLFAPREDRSSWL